MHCLNFDQILEFNVEIYFPIMTHLFVNWRLKFTNHLFGCTQAVCSISFTISQSSSQTCATTSRETTGPFGPTQPFAFDNVAVLSLISCIAVTLSFILN